LTYCVREALANAWAVPDIPCGRCGGGETHRGGGKGCPFAAQTFDVVGTDVLRRGVADEICAVIASGGLAAPLAGDPAPLLLPSLAHDSVRITPAIAVAFAALCVAASHAYWLGRALAVEPSNARGNTSSTVPRASGTIPQALPRPADAVERLRPATAAALAMSAEAASHMRGLRRAFTREMSGARSYNHLGVGAAGVLGIELHCEGDDCSPTALPPGIAAGDLAGLAGTGTGEEARSCTKVTMGRVVLGEAHPPHGLRAKAGKTAACRATATGTLGVLPHPHGTGVKSACGSADRSGNTSGLRTRGEDMVCRNCGIDMGLRGLGNIDATCSSWPWVFADCSDRSGR